MMKHITLTEASTIYDKTQHIIIKGVIGLTEIRKKQLGEREVEKRE